MFKWSEFDHNSIVTTIVRKHQIFRVRIKSALTGSYPCLLLSPAYVGKAHAWFYSQLTQWLSLTASLSVTTLNAALHLCRFCSECDANVYFHWTVCTWKLCMSTQSVRWMCMTPNERVTSDERVPPHSQTCLWPWPCTWLWTECSGSLHCSTAGSEDLCSQTPLHCAKTKYKDWRNGSK